MTQSRVEKNKMKLLLAICMGLFLFLASPKMTMAQTKMVTMDEESERIYQLLKTECLKVANGEKSSIITFKTSDFFDKTTYTYEELGVSISSANPGSLNSRAKEILRNQIKNKVEAALTRMKIDCPYELYWFDRTSSIQLDFSYTRNSQAIFFESADYISLTMNVAKDYQYNGISIKIDPQVIARAKTTISTVNAIVNKYANATDQEKILGYAKEVATSTYYDRDAISATYLANKGYGDPYQILSVFDQDASTGTVCEGYAKAFQFLCDRTDFHNAESYIVTGVLNSNNVTGTHMWNIVRLDGQSFIVDTTNTTAAKLDLILTGAVKVNSKYLVLNQAKQKMYYSYDAETKALYDPELLAIVHTHIADTAVTENHVAATCTSPESYDTVTYCKYCGEELSRESFVGEAGAHDYLNTTVARTCTTDGYKKHVCLKCGYTYTNSKIPSFGGHSWNAGTKKADTTVHYKCTRCTETKVVGTPKVVTKAVKVTVTGATSVKVNKSITLKATVTTNTGKKVNVKWTVNNSKYAKITSAGNVTGLKAGKGKKVVVTATATDGSGKKASKTIAIK